jgi:NAD(P)-dependent dehydrogenase (short-subunit alcohol dehydrogenase family)
MADESMNEERGLRCAVLGASGGIGAALVRQLAVRADVAQVHAGSRSGTVPQGAKVCPFCFDLTDEAAIAAAAAAIAAPLDLVIVATGILHRADGSGPEKSYRALDAAGMAELYAVHAIGPALVAKHFLPLLARDRRAVFAVLSARVGSISDNRLGGWHSYRAAKAALNMLVRNFAIEAARSNPFAVVAALHPGTVDTALSRPFQTNVAPGKLFTAETSAAHLLAVLDGLTPAQSGRHFAWDGAEIPA